MPRPEIVGYSSRWIEQFDHIAAGLRSAFGPAAQRIDHIGSTSVPGLDAKDCIDVQVTVVEVDAPLPAATRERLAELHYDELKSYHHDHVPAGCRDDPEQWSKRLWSTRSQRPFVNLHIRQDGSPNQRFALLFRDYLRARPAAAAGYSAAKRALATVCDDIEVYADVKDPIVDIIMAGAEDWAAQTGWTIRSAGR